MNPNCSNVILIYKVLFLKRLFCKYSLAAIYVCMLWCWCICLCIRCCPAGSVLLHGEKLFLLPWMAKLLVMAPL